MVTPGIGSGSSTTIPCGVAIASGVSCNSGAATRSLRGPRCFTDSSEIFRASVWKRSKSVFACHGGAMATPHGIVVDDPEPIPGVTMPKLVVVERDYPAFADMLAALLSLIHISEPT